MLETSKQETNFELTLGRRLWRLSKISEEAAENELDQEENIVLLSAFTFFHVVLSLVGIGSGFVVVYGLLASKRLDGWTGLFLATTVATSVTGFLFPFHGFLPSHGVGIVSLIVLSPFSPVIVLVLGAAGVALTRLLLSWRFI